MVLVQKEQETTEEVTLFTSYSHILSHFDGHSNI